MKITWINTVLVPACLMAAACQGPGHEQELYKASVIMPAGSSTSGVEGPAVDKAGSLYWVNFGHEGTIGRLIPGGEPEIFLTLPDGSTGNGIRFNSKGQMLIADYTGHNILLADMATLNISVLAHGPLMNQPNDIAVDSQDRIYASDPDWNGGKGRVWRIDTDGTVTLLDSLGITNGIEVSPDEKTLYVNGSGNLYAYNLAENGDISGRRILVNFPDQGMDGMRCDINGNIYITRYGQGIVACVSPGGQVLREIKLSGKCPTNIAFGGKDGCTAYVTIQDKGNLESFRTDTPGREWEMQRIIK